MARPPTLTRELYERIKVGYGLAPGDHAAAAEHAGCHRDTARRAWIGAYADTFDWAVAISASLATPYGGLALVRSLRESLDTVPGTEEDRAVAHAAALSRARRFFAARAKHFDTCGDDFDVFMGWLAKGMRAQTRTPTESLSLEELQVAVIIAGAYATVLDKLSLSMERLAATEQKLAPAAPPKPKGASLDPEKARKIVERWSRVLPAMRLKDGVQ